MQIHIIEYRVYKLYIYKAQGCLYNPVKKCNKVARALHYFLHLSIISFNRSVCSVGLLSDQEVILPIYNCIL